ncbi:MAG: acyl carrier protein [Kiritimatiellae bacterium]|nr:acyl carrier protein [Kiritimatiellia bacterium]MBR4523506.1 acyl carrier protein [Kiritimatiellia bacterium]
MTEQEVEKQIVDILVADFEIDAAKLKPETNLFTELDLDSIDAVDLVVRLQQATGKKVNPEDFKQIRTLGDVTQAVLKLVNG